MTLAVHGIIGAAVAQKFFPNHPWLGFLAGVASHYALDALPHWDYTLRSRQYEPDPLRGSLEFSRKFLYDLIFIGGDFLTGIVFTYLIFARGAPHFTVLVFGLLGGVLPDFLQFMYYALKREPFTFFQKVHTRAHYPVRWQRSTALGFLLQGGIAVLILALLRL